ncbi:hypothetical protein BCR41DRAFT_361049 [Lobosporangium transversale]|uniref:Uncharacterized protein n=1 Tax=Lobosporangium transversale TaxID=64571 RepID=A0A1Y2GDT6_9FUNG|nr:hypothetical protein BCR41DRAFT_361049 [Lobosporangium transversale]ORZ06309.1 hypothetical protein BCR41DRAFT_361049 [Lobosporangium transversale]|eukprot:XP_021877472.1 hypothetical protein BCR41DRAFT_361049 [Lobosporangium transversale]
MKSVSAQGSKQGNNSNGWTEEEEEDQGLEFRLFASQDVPTAVLLTQKEPEIFHAVHRERPDLDESPGSERMQHIAEAVIDTATVLNQSRVPWPRAFFAHKVIHVPFKQKTESTQKTKKSRRKREWEKKVKAGLIDQATIEATSRKIKVSESWGRKPFLVRKGLDPNTIDAGTRKIMKKDYNSSMRGRGARGGGRGGRGMAARGRDYSGDRDREHGADIPSAIDKTTQTQHQQKTADQNSLYGTKKDNKSRVKEISEPSNSVDRKNKSTAQPASSKATALTALVMSATTRAEATQHGMIKALPKDSQAASLPKKLKSSKQPSKLDNIMAILTGK